VQASSRSSEERAQSVNAAIRSLNPQEVVHVAYSIGSDSTDDPAMFFRIVPNDAASREDRLADVTSRGIKLVQFDTPHRELGLNTVFQFSQLLDNASCNHRSAGQSFRWQSTARMGPRKRRSTRA
jgi:hypothetical protein